MIKKAKKYIEQVFSTFFLQIMSSACLTQRESFFNKMDKNKLFADSHQSMEREKNGSIKSKFLPLEDKYKFWMSPQVVKNVPGAKIHI